MMHCGQPWDLWGHTLAVEALQVVGARKDVAESRVVRAGAESPVVDRGARVVSTWLRAWLRAWLPRLMLVVGDEGAQP